MLVLYDYPRSSACYRARIALNLKKLDYKKINVDLIKNNGEQHHSDYKAINPFELVPTLVENEKRITQSLAIIEYLDETYPTPALLPKDSYQKSLVRGFALAIAAEIHPLNNLRVRNYLTHELHASSEQSSRWYAHWIELGFSALEKQLVESPFTGEYCFGDTPTLADICLVPQVANAERFSCNLMPYPTLTRINACCQKHPAFIKAQPETT